MNDLSIEFDPTDEDFILVENFMEAHRIPIGNGTRNLLVCLLQFVKEQRAKDSMSEMDKIRADLIAKNRTAKISKKKVKALVDAVTPPDPITKIKNAGDLNQLIGEA